MSGIIVDSSGIVVSNAFVDFKKKFISETQTPFAYINNGRTIDVHGTSDGPRSGSLESSSNWSHLVVNNMEINQYSPRLWNKGGNQWFLAGSSDRTVYAPGQAGYVTSSVIDMTVSLKALGLE